MSKKTPLREWVKDTPVVALFVIALAAISILDTIHRGLIKLGLVKARLDESQLSEGNELRCREQPCDADVKDLILVERWTRPADDVTREFHLCPYHYGRVMPGFSVVGTFKFKDGDKDEKL